MRLHAKRPLTCLLISLSLLLSGCSPSTAQDVKRVSGGYLLSEQAMRDTVAGWTEARKVADVRQQALEALRDEVKAQQADLIRQLAELQREITAERSLWRSRVRRGKMQGFIYGAVLGFGGGYLVRRNNP